MRLLKVCCVIYWGIGSFWSLFAYSPISLSSKRCENRVKKGKNGAILASEVKFIEKSWWLPIKLFIFVAKFGGSPP